jgi:hypothetical protein
MRHGASVSALSAPPWRNFAAMIECCMGEGRLIRVISGESAPPKAAAYIVAESDKAKAMGIILECVAMPGDDIQDLGRVSEPLIMALNLAPGEFSPVDRPKK